MGGASVQVDSELLLGSSGLGKLILGRWKSQSLHNDI